MSDGIAGDCRRRVAALRAELEAEGLAGAVLSRPEHVFYMTGCRVGPAPAFLVVSSPTLLAVASAPVGECDTITYTDYDIFHGWSVVANAQAALAEALAAAGLPDGSAVGLELGHLPIAFTSTVMDFVGEPQEIGGLLERLRRIKDAGEIAQIEANLAANDRAFGAVRAMLAPGVTELDVWAAVYATMCDAAGEPIVLEADVGAGTRTDNPDVNPGHARIEPGDHVLVDVYAASHGYYADTTRNFVVGEPSARQREIHTILEEALAAGEAKLAPGARACDVDAAVRGTIERAGYGARFPHHTGHAYGLFQQEHPYLIPAETMALEPGMIVTIEPGIYVPGWGGMRLEASYAITGTRARRLDRYPLELIRIE
ncbi:MAG: aminopeptidase P family protein [Chloroflexi bacterium]|nr:aminopeptidase P family protein [Chloroflexota bacterium]